MTFDPCYHQAMKILNANQIQYHNHYISGSAFLTNLIPLNKQSFKAKSEFQSCDHVSNSQAKKISYLGE